MRTWLAGVVISLVGAAGAMAAPAPAAQMLDFFFVGGEGPVELEAEWTQSSEPTPIASDAGVSTDVGANGFEVALLFGSMPIGGGPLGDVTFESTADGGGFTAGVFSEAGSQIYAGSEAAPIFAPGSFQFSNGGLTITAAAPEPAGWALMLLGVGATGAGLRNRRRSVPVLSQ